VSRRSLRIGGIQGSNDALSALARDLNAELGEQSVVVSTPGS
jgi:hypothetical protein